MVGLMVRSMSTEHGRFGGTGTILRYSTGQPKYKGKGALGSGRTLCSSLRLRGTLACLVADSRFRFPCFVLVRNGFMPTDFQITDCDNRFRLRIFGSTLSVKKKSIRIDPIALLPRLC